MSPEHRAYLDAITTSSEYVLDLVEKLLDISTIESGKLHIHRTTIDLGQLVSKHVELITLLAGRKNIKLVLDVADEPAIINADASKIEQVLSNLTSNAIKFSTAGTVIKVCVRATPSAVEFSVEDQGPGIPADELQLLFRPFSTTSVQATAGERSTGLGLAIAQRIVEGHGGEIKVESHVGKGSNFRVILPRR